MKETIYNIKRELISYGGYIDNSPKYNVIIKIVKFRNDYKTYNNYYLNVKQNSFIKEFNNGDLIVIEYPIFFNSRTRSSLYNSKVCITNERLGKSEDVDLSRLCGFWDYIEEFSIIEED